MCFITDAPETKKMHRRLCVEKIYFNEDGTIDEVKMTSQGAGEPFAVGETIEGWRACEVDGGAYVDGTELVMCDGSSAIIRYANISDNSSFEIEAQGNGEISVYAGDTLLSDAKLGLYEIKLICKGNLRVRSIILK